MPRYAKGLIVCVAVAGYWATFHSRQWAALWTVDARELLHMSVLVGAVASGAGRGDSGKVYSSVLGSKLCISMCTAATSLDLVDRQ